MLLEYPKNKQYKEPLKKYVGVRKNNNKNRQIAWWTEEIKAQIRTIRRHLNNKKQKSINCRTERKY